MDPGLDIPISERGTDPIAIVYTHHELVVGAVDARGDLDGR